MESLVVPVLILLAVAAGVTLVARAISRRKATAAAVPPAPAPSSADLARTAAAKLSEDEHRRLYALIAQGQAMAAIKLYYEVSGDGLRASRDAVGALAAHPQPYRGAEAAPAEVEDDGALVFPDDLERRKDDEEGDDQAYERVRHGVLSSPLGCGRRRG